jgi:hypothetical protein
MAAPTFTILALAPAGASARAGYLQLRNKDGDFQSIKSTYVGSGSQYVFNHTISSPGLKTYRVLITGGPENLGAVSQTVQVNVAPAPAAALAPQGLTTPTPTQ